MLPFFVPGGGGWGVGGLEGVPHDGTDTSPLYTENTKRVPPLNVRFYQVVGLLPSSPYRQVFCKVIYDMVNLMCIKKDLHFWSLPDRGFKVRRGELVDNVND